MKKVSIIFVLFFALFLTNCGDTAPTTEDAINYNDKLITEETKVINAITDVDDAFATYDPQKIEPAMDNALKQIESSIKAVEEIGDFDGNSDFKDAVINLFNVFKKQLNTEYKEQLEIYKLPDEKYTEKEENRYNELLDKIDEGYNKAFNKFTEAQDNFAAKWGFELE